MSNLVAVIFVLVSFALTFSGFYAFLSYDPNVNVLIGKIILANIIICVPIIVRFFNLKIKMFML